MSKELRIGAGRSQASGSVSTPTFRSYATRTSSTENPHLAQKPTGLVVGDLIVIFVSGRNGLPTATPSGFTKRWESSSATIVYAVSYSKVADAGDVAASNFPVENNNSQPLFSATYAIQNGGEATLGIVDGQWLSYWQGRVLYDTYSAPSGSLVFFFAAGYVVEQFVITNTAGYGVGYPVSEMRDFEEGSDPMLTGCHTTINATSILNITMNFQGAPIGAFICYVLGPPQSPAAPSFAVSRDCHGILLAVRDNAAPQFAVSRDADGLAISVPR